MKRILILLLGISACCAQETIEKSLVIRRGKTGVIKLSCSGGTGYEWVLDKAPVLFSTTYTTRANTSRMGGPVTYSYKITVDKKVVPGQYQLQFKLIRPWEPDAIVQKATVLVTINK